MTRSEFLERLKKALGNDLSGAIIQENVKYYDSYIREETAKGRSETEVIAELGDPWVLARTVINAAEGRDTPDNSYDGDYGYEPEQKSYGGRYENAGHVYSFGLNSWWKKLLFVLAIVGVIMIVVLIISGLVSLLAPILIPFIIVMAIIRAIGRRY